MARCAVEVNGCNYLTLGDQGQPLFPDLEVIIRYRQRWDDVVYCDTITINNNRDKILTTEYTTLINQMSNLTEEVKD